MYELGLFSLFTTTFELVFQLSLFMTSICVNMFQDLLRVLASFSLFMTSMCIYMFQDLSFSEFLLLSLFSKRSKIVAAENCEDETIIDEVAEALVVPLIVCAQQSGLYTCISMECFYCRADFRKFRFHHVMIEWFLIFNQYCYRKNAKVLLSLISDVKQIDEYFPRQIDVLLKKYPIRFGAAGVKVFLQQFSGERIWHRPCRLTSITANN